MGAVILFGFSFIIVMAIIYSGSLENANDELINAYEKTKEI